MLKRIIGLTALLLSLVTVNGTVPAYAAYPDRTINIVIPFGAGGIVDLAARVIAEYIQEHHKVSVVVTCKPGGSGAPAMLELSKARPDGYTFGFTSMNVITMIPLTAKCGYTTESFAPVAQISSTPQALAVRADSGITSLQDLMNKAKAEPGKYNVASTGAMSAQRLFIARLNNKFPESRLNYIVYDSGNEATTALLGKHVTSCFMAIANHKPYLESGDFQLLAFASEERQVGYPDVPTFKEMLGDEFVYESQWLIVAPLKVPADRIEAFQTLLHEALQAPAVREKLEKIGMPVYFKNAADTGKDIALYKNMFESSLKMMKEE